MTGDGTTLMWEAKAAPGRAADLVEWAARHADVTAQIYRSADGRVVVIDVTGAGLPDPPGHLVARTPHAWRFTPVDR